MKWFVTIAGVQTANATEKNPDFAVLVLALMGLAALAVVAAVIVNWLKDRKKANTTRLGKD
jgi:hypothetical protein